MFHTSYTRLVFVYKWSHGKHGIVFLEPWIIIWWELMVIIPCSAIPKCTNLVFEIRLGPGLGLSLRLGLWLITVASDLRQYSCSCKMQHDYRIYVMFGIDHVELCMSPATPRFNTRSNFNKFMLLMRVLALNMSNSASCCHSSNSRTSEKISIRI